MPSATARRLFRAVVPAPLRPHVYNVLARLRAGGDPVRTKRTVELDFWRKTNDEGGGQLWNKHYPDLFLGAFGLTEDFYRDKRILDIGCGPAGSLEWATMAAERVGLDPLVGKYRELGIDQHATRYVESGSEAMPFEDGYFDIVSSLNSLDHVDDIDRTVAEMVRVLKPGGSILVIVDVNHAPTSTEPVTLPWDVPSWFGPSVRTVTERRFENPEGIYTAVLNDHEWDASRTDDRPGSLVARLEKSA